MPRPTLQNRTNFKTYIRHFRNKFNNVLQKLPEYWIDNMLSSKAAGITTTTDVNVVIFDNKDTVAITTAFNNDELIYIPALSGDEITLGIGSSSFTFNFGAEGDSVVYNGISYGLNDTIAISSTRVATVKGLGGLLIQGGNTPTYTVGVSTTIVSEGQSVDVTINTTDVGAGTTLYFNTATSMEAADFSDNSLTGSFNIVGVGATTGVATVTRTIANDFATEGQEAFSLTIRTNSTTGPVVATSSQITVNDVVPTYSVLPSTDSVNEGSSVVFTVTTNGVPNGSILYWTTLVTSGTVSASDFTDNALSGSFTVNNNTGSIARSITSDRTTETEEKFKLEIRITSTSGTIVTTSDEVTINDTSLNVGNNSNGLTFGPVQVNRDGGDASLASDWYTICGIDNLPEGSSIALFIDTSGSMTQATIQASYNLLVEKLNAKNITITSVTNPDEDWITPFLVDLP